MLSLSLNLAFSCVLLAWFFVLAIAEARAGGRAGAFYGGDARLITNFTLAAISVGASALLPLANVGSSIAAQQLHAGFLPYLRSSWVLAFVATVLGLTLAAYWTHRAMHSMRLLWRVHRVHHADVLLDVSTSLRHHPLELLITLPISAVVIFAIGAPVSAVLASETLLMAAALFGHADVRLPPRIDRALAWVLVTPRVHRLHHHPERRLHDSNYGDTFTFWDRLFGTFTDLPERLPVGLAKQPGRPDYLIDQMLSPLKAA